MAEWVPARVVLLLLLWAAAERVGRGPTRVVLTCACGVGGGVGGGCVPGEVGGQDANGDVRAKLQWECGWRHAREPANRAQEVDCSVRGAGAPFEELGKRELRDGISERDTARVTAVAGTMCITEILCN